MIKNLVRTIFLTRTLLFRGPGLHLHQAIPVRLNIARRHAGSSIVKPRHLQTHITTSVCPSLTEILNCRLALDISIVVDGYYLIISKVRSSLARRRADLNLSSTMLQTLNPLLYTISLTLYMLKVLRLALSQRLMGGMSAPGAAFEQKSDDPAV